MRQKRLKWHEYYDLMRKYKDEIGNVDIPVREIYPKGSNIPLGTWLKRQKILLNRKLGKIFEKLEESNKPLDYETAIKCLSNDDYNKCMLLRNLDKHILHKKKGRKEKFILEKSIKWQSSFDKLINFYSYHGYVPYNDNSYDSRKLTKWIKRQISINDNYIKNSYDPLIWTSKNKLAWKIRRIRLIEAVDFDFHNEKSLIGEEYDMEEEISRLLHNHSNKHKIEPEELLTKIKHMMENLVDQNELRNMRLINTVENHTEEYQSKFEVNTNDVDTLKARHSKSLFLRPGSINYINDIYKVINDIDIEQFANN